MSHGNMNITRAKGRLSGADLIQLKEIFFLTSSRQKFASDLEKAMFFYGWAGIYLDNFSDQVYLAKNEDGKIIGYLLGCKNTLYAMEDLHEYNKSLDLFKDFYEKYPAHFHINCHPSSQGLGVGSKIMSLYINELKEDKIKGVHLITSPDSKNVKFYKKNGFDKEVTRTRKEAKLHFMGRLLSTKK